MYIFNIYRLYSKVELVKYLFRTLKIYILNQIHIYLDLTLLQVGRGKMAPGRGQNHKIGKNSKHMSIEVLKIGQT